MYAKSYGLFLGILLSVCSVEGMQLQVDRVDSPAGAEDIAVHLTAEDAEGLAGGDLEIHYDADLLAVGEIETGNLSSGWMLATNQQTDGAIRLSLAGQTGTQLATGSLIVLHFSVLSEVSPGAVAPIRLVDVRLYDETATPFDMVDLQDGALRVIAEVPPPSEEESIDPFSLEISSVSGSPGAEVSVQIDVDRTAEIAGGDFTMTYDPALLIPLSVEPTLLSSGLMLAANLSTPGRIAVSLAGATGMPEGEGAILTVRFTVAAEAVPGVESPLSLTHVRLIDTRAVPLPIGPITAGRLRIASQFPDLDPEGGMEGDFNLDGEVGFPDFFLFAERFGLVSGDSGYSAIYDLDRDGQIFFPDFFLFVDLLDHQRQVGN